MRHLRAKLYANELFGRLRNKHNFTQFDREAISASSPYELRWCARLTTIIVDRACGGRYFRLGGFQPEILQKFDLNPSKSVSSSVSTLHYV
jgi:hypothetical protein